MADHGPAPDLFLCPDCNQPTAPDAPDHLCPACAQWRREKLAEMDQDWQDRQERLARRRMTPSERFAEELVDLVKATERSKQ